MPKNHARKKALAELKAELGIKHADAIALLDHPDADERETLYEYLETYVDINTYKEAVDYLRQEQNDPANQIMCTTCGWTNNMVCPECAKGCGCSVGCTGWRHGEYTDPDENDDYDEDGDCYDCGADGDPYAECTCYDDEDSEAA
ncbi:hypothetical protein [Streptomyces rubradiris]|uniref:Uncharacterized protein n=1 Tax=Streptomyces rubradiris TaxID=285531 RepID=A0ABQ3RAB1_STRRR|nr:hypothetical protein [Streptomyces rubradiris]GHH25994.1 hypothetical protein GCM10018792_65870 [Streptomyces rubradiris]GHI52792.1 hypothetical protein Srubr_26380 [Streptomyces rubradiris]